MLVSQFDKTCSNSVGPPDYILPDKCIVYIESIKDTSMKYTSNGTYITETKYYSHNCTNPFQTKVYKNLECYPMDDDIHWVKFTVSDFQEKTSSRDYYIIEYVNEDKKCAKDLSMITLYPYKGCQGGERVQGSETYCEDGKVYYDLWQGKCMGTPQSHSALDKCYKYDFQKDQFYAYRCDL